MKIHSAAVFAVTLTLSLNCLAAEVTDVASIVEQLTLEEKACLITGINKWETCPVPRLGIPSVWMADGPVGLRKNLGAALTDSVPATCFPSAAAMAATWHPELIEKVGAGIGAEAHASDVTLLLAPGLNLKRHPLGGRNFEYYSEDPLLAGKIAAAFVRGVQSQGVGATLKHYAANNQEHRRMSIDARIDERTLRELYLRGFEIAVTEGRPQAIMSAYNRLNGTYTSQSRWLLTDVLRGEWGFDGLVVSDWGAVDDPVASIAAGLDLEMPGNPLTPAIIVKAVENGELDLSHLDRAVAKVLQLVTRQSENELRPKTDALTSNHELAREVAAESMVLLKNDGVLPIEGRQGRRIGVVGNLAVEPRIQGIGSSQISTPQVETPWNHLQAIGDDHGYQMRLWPSEYQEDGLAEVERKDLAEFAKDNDLILVFAGQKASHDAEAWDRPSMDLAPGDLATVETVRDSGTPFAVVLAGGGAVDVRPFAAETNAMLMGWLGGQAFGSAVAEVVFGLRSPSGRLSETFSRNIEDHASAMNFPAGPLRVNYGEGLSVGYRYFQTFGQEVMYPFGHGLDYTTFDYTDVRVPETLESLDRGFSVEVTVSNIGDRAGTDVVQVYARQIDSSYPQPDRQLIGFEKVSVQPGASTQVSIHIDSDRLAYFHQGHGRWVIEPGRYEILVGASAGAIQATVPLSVVTGTMPREIYTLYHIIGDVYRDPRGKIVIDHFRAQRGQKPLSETAPDDFRAAVQRNLPFKKISNFSGGAVSVPDLEKLLDLINSDVSPEVVASILEEDSQPRMN
jgi:beta-glucosidase